MADVDDMRQEDGVHSVHSGFPSPSQDYMKGVIDLNRELVRHPEATFYGRVVSDSMSGAGIGKGDVLVIDRALDPGDGDMAVCFLEGEFCIRRVAVRKDGIWLLDCGKGEHVPAKASDGDTFRLWGVVTYVIRKVH